MRDDPGTRPGQGGHIFGYSQLYGSQPGGQHSTCAFPKRSTRTSRCRDGPADDRFVYLSDVLPTAWQAVAYADAPAEGTLLVLGLGPIGDMACRIALHLGVRQVIGVDRVRARLDRAAARGVTTLDLGDLGDGTDVANAVRELTAGRGADAVIDAVGMEAHGAPVVEATHKVVSALPDPLGRRLMTTVGIDRLAAVRTAIDAVRRGGTISLSGVYGGMADPLPMMTLFDKQVQLRMAGQRQALDRGHPAPADRRGPPRCRRLRNPPPPPRGRPRGVRHLPGQGRRDGQGGALSPHG